MASRDRERGAITPVIAMAAMGLAVLAMGGVSLGRIAAARKDAQRAADAAALAAANITRDTGLPFQPAKRIAAQNIGSGNSQLPVTYTWAIAETADAVTFTVTSRIELEVSRLIYPSGRVTVEARAKSQVPQDRFDEATRRLPKLVLVLDYSGSMNQIMPASGGRRAIDVLEDSVRNLLDSPSLAGRIEYGAVFFSSNTFATVSIGPGAPAQIRSYMNLYGAGGMTCTSCGLNNARNLLTASGEDTGRYVLLVSDGQPNNGGGESGARAAAGTIWGVNGSIYTLHIDWSGGSDGSLASFMRSVSGTPTSHPAESMYYRAADATTLRSVFETVVASIICSVGPLDPAPGDPSALRVYLRDGSGDERAVPAVPPGVSLGDPTVVDLEYYRYDSPTRTVRLTEAACDAVIDGGDDIVVRFADPGLTE